MMRCYYLGILVLAFHMASGAGAAPAPSAGAQLFTERVSEKEPAGMPALPGYAQNAPGTVHILQVTLPDRAAVDTLSAAGLIIDNVEGTTATVYASPEDLQWLTSRGYAYVEIGRQWPQPAAKPHGHDEALPSKPVPAPKTTPAYHTYATVTSSLQAYAAAHPGLCRLITVGRSVQGRELWALLITDNPDLEEDEPEFKYVSTMHGDEPVGTELCLYFIDRLLTDYGTDARVTDLVNATAIWIMPVMNPDGLEAGTRANARGRDLNRSFPVFPADFQRTVFDGEPLGAAGREPEVARVMEWTAQNSFVLSANMHTGALVVNYAFDDDGFPTGTNSPTPDDALFRNISLRYSTYNTPMYNNNLYPFQNGIVNGARWYVITGGMQDWHYRYAGCNEVTLELSTIKKPSASTLPALWANNEESMFRYLEAVHIGARGLVTDRVTGQPIWAAISVEGNSQRVFTDPDVGDYHRLLLPGTYTLRVVAPGYESQTVSGVVVGNGAAARVDVALVRAGGVNADVNGDQVVDALDVQWVINAALGLPGPYNCDLDGGGVTATDVQLVINAALRL